MEKYFTVNSDGCSIRCKLYTNDDPVIGKVVLGGHGFGGHKDNKAAEKLAKHILSKNKGVVFITFDWPCHGEDVRKALRLDECSKYVKVMTEYVKSVYPSAELFGYATSFGGYLFLRYMLEAGNPFSKLALRCPAVGMYDVLMGLVTEEDLKLISRGKPAFVGFDRKIRVDKQFIDSLKAEDITERDFTPFASDILIIQGTNDEIVPFETVERFADRNDIDFEAVEGADHRFLDPVKMDMAIELYTALYDMK